MLLAVFVVVADDVAIAISAAAAAIDVGNFLAQRLNATTVVLQS